MALTFIALAFLVAAAIAIRRLVPRWSPSRRRQLSLVLAFILLPALLNTLSRWETTSHLLNALLLWSRLFAYELCIALFTLVRPRAVTTTIAVILTLPLFASSVAGPASSLFSREQSSLHPIRPGYILDLLPWSSGPGQNGGADFSLIYQPLGVRFLRRPFMGARLYNTQCRTADTTATIDPTTAHITVHCPPLTSDPAASPSGTDFDYLIPPNARSPDLAHSLPR